MVWFSMVLSSSFLNALIISVNKYSENPPHIQQNHSKRYQNPPYRGKMVSPRTVILAFSRDRC
jgi:hypothetical protein